MNSNINNDNNINSLKKDLFEYGFNLFGITDLNKYEKENISRFFPNTKSLIIFGSGGKYFWKKFKTISKKNNFPLSIENPIDDYTEIISSIMKQNHPKLIENYVYPFYNYEFTINYQKIAELAGIGNYSPYIKLVINPEFGSWISLRGIFLSSLNLPNTKLTSINPCIDCHKPCLTICPVNAVTEEKFDFFKCAYHRVKENECKTYCNVRKECIIGKKHIYSEEESIHRNNSSLNILKKYYKFNT